jgi:regulator of sigma E protease
MTLGQIPWIIAALAVLITVHEYGHYRMAVACGVRVLRFSFGFGKVIWRHQKDADATEFVVSALPFGGYVRMLGDRDGEDVIEGGAALQRGVAFDVSRTLNGRPLWQRALVVVAGPVANLLLAVALFTTVQLIGIREPAAVLGTPPAESLMAAAGLVAGDRIVAISDFDAETSASDADWRTVRSINDLYDEVARGVLDHRALRLRTRAPGDGGTRDIALRLDQLPDRDVDGAFVRIGLGRPLASAVLGEPQAGGPADRAGLRAGDRIVRANDMAVPDAGAFVRLIRAAAHDGQVDTVRLEVLRHGQRVVLEVTPALVDDHGTRVARIGVPLGEDADAVEHVLVRDPPIAALVEGVRRTGSTAVTSLKMLGHMLVGQASLKNLSGPITIGVVVGKTASLGFAFYLGTLATVSVGLGVLNLLPLPILDGGTLMYYLFEGVTGRPVSELWLARLQRGGLLILLLLMSLALSNDVARLLGLQ